MIEDSKLDTVIIRDLLKKLLKSDVSFDAFFVDFFPEIFRRFSNNMDTELKLNIVLLEIEPLTLLAALKRKFSLASIDDAMQFAIHNNNRKSNPSLLNLLEYLFLKKKMTIFMILSLAAVVIWGDPASWRMQALPFIKSLLNRDPSKVLEEAKSDLAQKNYDIALEKAHCVLLMSNSSPDQKYTANLIVLYIQNIKALKIIDNKEKESMVHGLLPEHIKHIRELAALDTSSIFEISSQSLNTPGHLSDDASNGFDERKHPQSTSIQADSGVSIAGVPQCAKIEPLTSTAPTNDIGSAFLSRQPAADVALKARATSPLKSFIKSKERTSKFPLKPNPSISNKPIMDAPMFVNNTQSDPKPNPNDVVLQTVQSDIQLCFKGLKNSYKYNMLQVHVYMSFPKAEVYRLEIIEPEDDILKKDLADITRKTCIMNAFQAKKYHQTQESGIIVFYRSYKPMSHNN